MTFKETDALPFQIFEILNYNDEKIQLRNIENRKFDYLHYQPSKAQKTHLSDKNPVGGSEKSSQHMQTKSKSKSKDKLETDIKIDFYKYLKKNKNIRISRKQNNDILIQYKSNMMIIHGHEWNEYKQLLFLKTSKKNLINQYREKIKKLGIFLNEQQLKAVKNPIVISCLFNK